MTVAETVAAIASDEVHAWFADPREICDTPARLGYQAVLSTEEQARTERFQFDRDRQAFLVAHGLLRMALSSCAPAIPAVAWSFQSNRYGRPKIAGPKTRPRLHFSISHTSELVGCLVAADIDCGIDIEAIDRISDFRDLCNAVLAPSELSSISALPASEQPARFIQYWTLKEAYAKARGLGMSLPFHQCAFRICRGGISLDPALHDDARDWHFEQRQITPRHVLAIALRSRGSKLRICQHAPFHYSPALTTKRQLNPIAQVFAAPSEIRQIPN